MLSNITVNGVTPKLGGNIADGQWTYKTVTVASGTWNESNRRYNFSVSNYLPDNIYTYEVLIGCYSGTDSTSGHTSAWWVHNSDGQLPLVMGYCRTRTSSNVTSANSGILATKQVDGILTFTVSGSSTGGSGLYLWGYRRVGTIDTDKTYYTLKVNPTPSDATVSFSGGTIVGTNTCKVLAGRSVTYYVTRSGYTAQHASVTMNGNKEVNVTLTIPYTPNQVLYESSTGGASTTLTLEVDGRYQVICVGGGGGGSAGAEARGSGTSRKYLIEAAGGGSGSGFNVVYSLTAGSYAIKVGAGGTKSSSNHGAGGAGGDSQFGTSYARGGGGGKTSSTSTTAGTAGAAPTLSYTRQVTTLNTAGNAGSTKSDIQAIPKAITASGGASIYSSKGTGGQGKTKTSSAYNDSSAGVAGYVKVIYIGV